MSDRTRRHEVLLRLVEGRPVSSQAELIEALASMGQEVHQSTLSRALRELGIRKADGRYRALDAVTATEVADPPAEAMLPVVHAFTACGPNLITVHVGTGQAQLLGVLLDRTEQAPIAGTIAGDDTVLIVTKGRADQLAALALLTEWFGEAKRDAG